MPGAASRHPVTVRRSAAAAKTPNHRASHTELSKLCTARQRTKRGSGAPNLSHNRPLPPPPGSSRCPLHAPPCRRAGTALRPNADLRAFKDKMGTLLPELKTLLEEAMQGAHSIGLLDNTKLIKASPFACRVAPARWRPLASSTASHAPGERCRREPVAVQECCCPLLTKPPPHAALPLQEQCCTELGSTTEVAASALSSLIITVTSATVRCQCYLLGRRAMLASLCCGAMVSSVWPSMLTLLPMPRLVNLPPCASPPVPECVA